MLGMFLVLAAGAALVNNPIDAASMPRVNVEYRDLNLTSQYGQERLRQRISRAAQQLCRESGPMNLAEKRAFDACLDDVFATSMPKADSVVAQAQQPGVASTAAAAAIIQP